MLVWPMPDLKKRFLGANSVKPSRLPLRAYKIKKKTNPMVDRRKQVFSGPVARMQHKLRMLHLRSNFSAKAAIQNCL